MCWNYRELFDYFDVRIFAAVFCKSVLEGAVQLEGVRFTERFYKHFGVQTAKSREPRVP